MFVFSPLRRALLSIVLFIDRLNIAMNFGRRGAGRRHVGLVAPLADGPAHSASLLVVRTGRGRGPDRPYRRLDGTDLGVRGPGLREVSAGSSGVTTARRQVGAGTPYRPWRSADRRPRPSSASPGS